MGEIIQNVEHANPPFIEEKNVNDMDIVENEVEEIQMNKIENVITNDDITMIQTKGSKSYLKIKTLNRKIINHK